MDLEEHPRPGSVVAQPFLDTEHGYLDEISRGSLDGSVNGHPFTVLTGVGIFRFKFGQGAPPLEQRLDVACLAGFLQHLFGELPYTRVHIKIPIDDPGSLSRRDT